MLGLKIIYISAGTPEENGGISLYTRETEVFSWNVIYYLVAKNLLITLKSEVWFLIRKLSFYRCLTHANVDKQTSSNGLGCQHLYNIRMNFCIGSVSFIIF